MAGKAAGRDRGHVETRRYRKGVWREKKGKKTDGQPVALRKTAARWGSPEDMSNMQKGKRCDVE